MGKCIDLTGQQFDRLTAIRTIGMNKSKQTQWVCICTCGKEIVTTMNHLRTGHTRSCGCLKIERSTKHGMWKTPEYYAWSAIIQRCTNSNAQGYKNYGGRGISVCGRWLKFENFFADMGERPEKRSIDRINNNGNYELSNCRWATRKQQRRNMQLSSKNTTGVTGVHTTKAIKNKYCANIHVNGKTIYLGLFHTISKAAEARRLAEIKYWGEATHVSI